MTHSIVSDRPTTGPVLTLVESPGYRNLAAAALSSRERDVLQLLADGLSTREVARRLNYSERTIKNVLQHLTVRLDLRNRTQAVAVAVRNGWI